MSDEIAIAHGSLTSDGGAERVALELAREFDAPIFAARVDEDWLPTDVDARQVLSGRWARFFESDRGKPGPIYWALRHLYRAQRLSWIEDLYEYDTVIISKDEMAWFVPRAEQTIVRYVHSTPRRLYDQHHRRASSAVTRCWSTVMRSLKEPRQRYADALVANSDAVRRRIKKYWRADDSRVHTVYPPVSVDSASPQRAMDSNYLLYIGRLAQNKRIDMVVELSEKVDQTVVIAGDGPYRETVENGPDNIEYLGYVSEAEKWRLLSEAQATLFFAESEDFGIVPIESMASGTPVIGVREGMTQYQIREGSNGYLCEADVESAVKAVEQFQSNGISWSVEELVGYAKQFGAGRFREQMRVVVDGARNSVEVTPHVQPEPPALRTDGGDHAADE